MHPTPPALLKNFSKTKPTRRSTAQRSIAGIVGLTLGFCTAVVSDTHADEIDDYIAAQMNRQHIPGLSLAVLKHGTAVKMKSYGVDNLTTGTRTTPESVFQIGSISKQFIAAGIVRLSEEGKVSLDDSIRKYLSDAPETWQAITLRHLLTHTSGLVRETPGLQLKVQSDIEAIRGAYAVPLAFAPGEKWQYSNLGYFALAEVISRAAQIPWPQYLHEKIFAPLGMNATRTTTVDDVIPHRVSGYQWMDTHNHQETPNLPGVRPSGALLSSVFDLAKWDAALSSGTFFSPQQRELMWTPVKLNDGSEKPYGFGWEIGKAGKHRQVKHAGTMLGFRSQILKFPDDGLTIVVLTNATQAVPEKIALGVAALSLPDLKPPSKRTVANVSAEILDACAGRYQLAGGRALSVVRHENKLAVSMPLALPGASSEIAALVQGVSMDVALLTPETETRFFDEDDSRATYVFSKDADGNPQLVVENAEGKAVQKASRLAPKN